MVKIFTWRQKLGDPACPYMVRWVADFGLFSVRLHHWLRSDDQRHFHDHPWPFIMFMLAGKQIDITPEGEEVIRAPYAAYRSMPHLHKVKTDGCWTLLITGPKLRYWGFWVGDKWFVATRYFRKVGHHPCE